MTAEERRAYVRRVVDAAPPPTAEDAATLRAFMALGRRTPTARGRATPRTTRANAA